MVLFVALAPMVKATQAQAEPTGLTFWSFVPDHENYWMRQADHWNADNPDRPIKLTATDYPWAD